MRYPQITIATRECRTRKLPLLNSNPAGAVTYS
jgi:hypothetical protein